MAVSVLLVPCLTLTNCSPLANHTVVKSEMSPTSLPTFEAVIKKVTAKVLDSTPTRNDFLSRNNHDLEWAADTAIKRFKDEIPANVTPDVYTRSLTEVLIDVIVKNGSKYNLVIHDLDADFEHKLHQQQVFRMVLFQDKVFGVWIFKCGHFETHDKTKWRWSAQNGSAYLVHNGMKVLFNVSDCPV